MSKAVKKKDKVFCCVKSIVVRKVACQRFEEAE